MSKHKYFNKELHQFLHKKYNEEPINTKYKETKHTKYNVFYIEYIKNNQYSSSYLYDIFSGYPGCYVYFVNDNNSEYYSIYVYHEDINHIKTLLSHLCKLDYIKVHRRTKYIVLFNNYINQNKVFKCISAYKDEFYPDL